MLLSLFFAIITIQTGLMFYRAANNNKTVLIVLITWAVLQGILSQMGFYTDTTSIPPRLIFLAPPTLLFIAFLFLTERGRRFLDSLSLQKLTLLHSVRVPVEIVLYFLYSFGVVPELMTFEGRNFDILSGITAPLVHYLFFVRKVMGRTGLLIWNIVCLGLLINIVANAVLSAPYAATQQFAFDQPNIGVLYFPFTWLPGFVVPIVLLSHLAAIRQLLSKRYME